MLAIKRFLKIKFPINLAENQYHYNIRGNFISQQTIFHRTLCYKGEG